MPFNWLTPERLRQALKRIPETQSIAKFRIASVKDLINRNRVNEKVTSLRLTIAETLIKALTEKIQNLEKRLKEEIPEELKETWRKREKERLRMEYSK